MLLRKVKFYLEGYLWDEGIKKVLKNQLLMQQSCDVAFNLFCVERQQNFLSLLKIN